MAQITVGLDFGTHQSKICIERKEGSEIEYSFFTFRDMHGNNKYTLPSIVQIKEDETLEYGYICNSENSRIIRYFKQALFADSYSELSKEEAMMFSIWYIAFIIFDLESVYNDEFVIQMGVPSDGAHLKAQRRLAVSLLLSAYNLVENVFNNDKKAFLKTPILELKKKTEIIKYSFDKKNEFGILVLPEAYACLMPLVTNSKISGGMSLLVDIGGGTTDISFFTIDKSEKQKNHQLKVYHFTSINKGLNYLTDLNVITDNNRLDSNISTNSQLNKAAIKKFNKKINLLLAS